MTNFTMIAFGLLLAITGCGPGNEAHNSGIGYQYSFTKFTLTDSTGTSFSLNDDELKALESDWGKTQIPDEINICNKLIQIGTQLEYEYVLNDGFRMKFDANFGTVDGKEYLGFQLLGDGGGFPGDVYGELIVAESVFSNERLDELKATFQNK